MQMIHQVIGQGDGVVIGCPECGIVQHLTENEVHRCNQDSPFAVTLDASRLTSPAKPYPR